MSRNAPIAARGGMVLAVALLLCAAATPGLAIDYTSAQSGTWGTNTTWSPQGVPGVSDNVFINHQVTLNASYSVNNITINSGGQFRITSSYTLQVYGDWTNNGAATLTNGYVFFRGSSNGTIGGSTTTSFYRLTVNKSATSNTVTMDQNVTCTYTSSGALNITRGTFITNGHNLNVNTGSARVTGDRHGTLRINDGTTANFYYMYQWGLGRLEISGAATTVNIARHDIANSGHRTDISGGTVNYTATGATNNLQLWSNNGSWGWYATGGTITFYGSISNNVQNDVFSATGSAVIRFAGDQNSTFNVANYSSSSGSNIRFNDLRIEKTGGAKVTLTTRNNPHSFSPTAVIGVTVNLGAHLELGGNFASGYGYDFNNVTNNGIITQGADRLFVSGDGTGTGNFNHGSKLVTLDGSGDKSFAPGSGSFYDIVINKPTFGSLTLTGDLTVEDDLTVTAGAFAVGEHTLTMGTSTGSGDVDVNGGTFSVVGTAFASGTVAAANMSFPYSFDVVSGATIAARYADFEHMNNNGINIASGAGVHGTNNFSDCTFDHGSQSGQMLRVENNQTIDDMRNVDFTGTTGYNIYKGTNQGHITVTGGSGTRWGEDYDNDPNDLVDWIIPRDVGVTKIEAPPGLVDSGTVVTPACSVYNYGATTESYDVRMRIGTFYSETYPVSGHAPGDRLYVEFADWTVEELDSHVVSCSTELVTDIDHSNDSAMSLVFVQVLDVGAVSITTPSGLYTIGQTIYPAATWHNYGNLAADFEAWMILEDPSANRVYEHKVDLTGIAPGGDILVSSFPSYPLSTGGSWAVRCSTYYAGDMKPGNDTIDDNFMVGSPDIGVLNIVAPHGDLDTSTVVTPQGRVRNFGDCVCDFEAWFVINDPTDVEVYNEHYTVSGLVVGAESTLTFPTHNVGTEEGHWATRCSVHVAGDVQPNNDSKEGWFNVSSFPPWPGGWHEVEPMPLPPSQKSVKRGGWLAFNEGNGLVYAAKGYKTTDFYRYHPVGDSWHGLTGMPYETHPLWSRKVPRKGSKGVSDGDNSIYVTQGNNTLGFWRYDIVGGSWGVLPDVPLGPYRKKVKGGTDLAFVPGEEDGDDYVYLLKGYKTEFYRYNVATSKWDTLAEAPDGTRAKWDKGSWLVFNEADGTDDAKLLYAHKAKYHDGTYHELWKYNIVGDSWSGNKLKGMPLEGLHSGRLKRKKSKDGGCGAWYDDEIYALKGGNTQQYFRYTPAADSWHELDTVPNYTVTTGRKRRVKYGADIVSYGGGVFFALKGNKTRELWRYVIPYTLAARPSRDGVMAGRGIQKSEFRIQISPNPLASGFATLRYTLPKAGPVDITIYDIAGRAVKRIRVTPCAAQGCHPMNLRSLSAGVYLVRLDADGFTATRKLVVQH